MAEGPGWMPWYTDPSAIADEGSSWRTPYNYSQTQPTTQPYLHPQERQGGSYHHLQPPFYPVMPQEDVPHRPWTTTSDTSLPMAPAFNATGSQVCGETGWVNQEDLGYQRPNIPPGVTQRAPGTSWNLACGYPPIQSPIPPPTYPTPQGMQAPAQNQDDDSILSDVLQLLEEHFPPSIVPQEELPGTSASAGTIQYTGEPAPTVSESPKVEPHEEGPDDLKEEPDDLKEEPDDLEQEPDDGVDPQGSASPASTGGGSFIAVLLPSPSPPSLGSLSSLVSRTPSPSPSSDGEAVPYPQLVPIPLPLPPTPDHLRALANMTPQIFKQYLARSPGETVAFIKGLRAKARKKMSTSAYRRRIQQRARERDALFYENGELRVKLLELRRDKARLQQEIRDLRAQMETISLQLDSYRRLRLVRY